MHARRLFATLALMTLLPSCGLIDRIRGTDEDETGGETGGDTNEASPSEGEGTAEASPTPESGPAPAYVMPKGPERFKHWSPRHAFIGSPTTVASVVSDAELIVATANAHVGVSVDGGESWRWTWAGDAVRDVAGYPGGPYALLHEGAISISSDGMIWRRLPRFSSDSLIDLVAADIGFVAIGKSGGFIHVGKDGSGGHGGTLPDKFKPKAITELNGAVLAWSGKTGYGTADGTTWTELEQLPLMPDGKTYFTSAGSCSIGKVGKRKGVVCKVSGNAYGIGDEFIVDNKGVVALTRDGGETWLTSALPFKGANSIFGAPGGPYYAVGNNGAVAISKDGGGPWVDQKWEESANLLDGVIEGDTIIIVGAKSTLIYSTNGGNDWEYALPPAKNLTWVIADGGNFIASDGRAFITSSNGVDWVESEDEYELPGKPGPCDEAPEDGEQCRYATDVTTPEDIPDVRGLSFTDDVGLALGDDGLVAVSTDGGGSWSEVHGFDLERYGATDFAIHEDQVLVTDGSALMASSDAGATWTQGELLRKYKINAVHVSDAGLWIAAAKDEILRAQLDAATWFPAEDEPIKGDWGALFEVSGVLYASNSKGGLIRSEDGDSWTEVVTGISRPVIDMAGDGDNVWAVTSYAYGRRSTNNNVLLRSEDGGAHFIVVRELPYQTSRPDLQVEGDAVVLSDIISRDHGDSWKKGDDRYFAGLVDLADGSGMKISSRGAQLRVVTGDGEDDWMLIDSAFGQGSKIACSASSGCWALSGGVLYRPLGR